VIGVRIDVTAEKIFRIAADISVAIKGIFRTTWITDATTATAFGATAVTETITEETSGVTEGTEVISEEIFRATEDIKVITEDISGVIGDSGEIIKRISEPIVKPKGITNDIIPHGQIIASDILPNATGINIQPDSTEEDAGVSLKDVRFLSVKINGNLTQADKITVKGAGYTVHGCPQIRYP
jgi:hypothetical protein